MYPPSSPSINVHALVFLLFPQYMHCTLPLYLVWAAARDAFSVNIASCTTSLVRLSMTQLCDLFARPLWLHAYARLKLTTLPARNDDHGGDDGAEDDEAVTCKMLADLEHCVWSKGGWRVDENSTKQQLDADPYDITVWQCDHTLQSFATAVFFIEV